MTSPTKLLLHQDGVDAGKETRVYTTVSGMCFRYVMPNISLRLVVWKWFSFFSAVDKLSTFHSHKGENHRTTDRYTLILVASEMPLRFHTILLSRPKATFAFASLVFTSSSITIDLERVLPREINFSTAFSHCPLLVMLGSTYGFPGAGWCITSIFFELIVKGY